MRKFIKISFTVCLSLGLVFSTTNLRGDKTAPGGSSSRPPSSSGGSSSRPPSSSGGSSSRPPSSSGGSSSRPPSGSSSSKPPSGGSSRPPSSNNQGKPKYSGSSAPKQPSEPKKPEGGKPKYSGPGSKSSESKKPEGGKPKYSGSGNKPVENNAGSRKPKTEVNDKARAAKKVESERKYTESKKATAPPKTEYRTKDGKEVKIHPGSKNVEYIRNQPGHKFTPEARQRSINVHVNNYHYGHPYNWYYSQPHFYVGGGYSSVFWWMMLEWDAERRARWLYNHQYEIDQAAYQRGLQDAQVSQYVTQMRSQNIRPNADYVDPEFANDPSMQYDQEYIDAAYNPQGRANFGAVLKFIGAFTLIVLVCVGLWYLIFRVRFGN